MTKFMLYQINFTDAQIAMINSPGPKLEFYDQYISTIMRPTPEAIIKAGWQYRLVAEIDVKELPGDTIDVLLEQAFMIANGDVAPGTTMRKLDKMHSMSVGDVLLEEETKQYWYVDSIGFKKVDLRFPLIED